MWLPRAEKNEAYGGCKEDKRSCNRYRLLSFKSIEADEKRAEDDASTNATDGVNSQEEGNYGIADRLRCLNWEHTLMDTDFVGAANFKWVGRAV